MKILSMGYEFEHPSVESTTYRSSISLFDYDIVIWDPNRVIYEYSKGHRFMGCVSLSDDDSANLAADRKRRMEEMAEMIKLGRTIIIFTPEPEKYYLDTGKREYSGTGRNRQTTRILEDIDLVNFLPVKNVRIIKAGGAKMEFRGKEPFDLFWKTNSRYFSYRAYFENPIGTPLFFIKGTQKVVGSVLNIEKGNLIFIPNFLEDYVFDEDEDAYEIERKFIESIIELINDLNKNTGDFKLPIWCSNYQMPGEFHEKDKLKKLEQKLRSIESKISDQKISLAKFGEYEILFSGDGRALEIEVGKIFSELGFDVAEGLPGRDDLIVKYGDRIAVIEVKGVTKSAAEKHAAQLEKWVSEYYTQKGIKPKGILVINTHKDTPLKERDELPFPDQMIPFSKNREHCLITGFQLLGLYLDCRDNPVKKEKMVNLMLDTNGVFAEYDNWSSFLDLIETSEKEEDD